MCVMMMIMLLLLLMVMIADDAVSQWTQLWLPPPKWLSRSVFARRKGRDARLVDFARNLDRRSFSSFSSFSSTTAAAVEEEAAAPAVEEEEVVVASLLLDPRFPAASLPAFRSFPLTPLMADEERRRSPEIV